MLHKLLPVALLALLIAGCGSTQSAKSKHHPKLAPTTVTHPQPVSSGTGTIVFGTKYNGHSVKGVNTSFSKPASMVFVAHMRNTPGSRLITVKVVRTNGPGTFPRTVWTAKASAGKGSTVITHLTSSQLKADNITAGGNYKVTYYSSNQAIASGNFQLSKGSGASHVGY